VLTLMVNRGSPVQGPGSKQHHRNGQEPESTDDGRTRRPSDQAGQFCVGFTVQRPPSAGTRVLATISGVVWPARVAKR
jgi:hypothetical protein